MANEKNILPPPINPQEKPITVAVLSGKLDYLFKNVQELVTTTARGTESVLRKEMQEMEKRLDSKIDGVEKCLINVENDVKEIKTTVKLLDEKISDDHEERIVALEKSLTTHA